MGHKATPEYETAQDRISSLIAEIGVQLTEIASANDVDSIIAEQDKSGFIQKQADIISNYRLRDDNDTRDAYIAELEARLKKAESDIKYHSERWYKEYARNRHLKAALNSLTAVLNED